MPPTARSPRRPSSTASPSTSKTMSTRPPSWQLTMVRLRGDWQGSPAPWALGQGGTHRAGWGGRHSAGGLRQAGAGASSSSVPLPPPRVRSSTITTTPSILALSDPVSGAGRNNMVGGSGARIRQVQRPRRRTCVEGAGNHCAAHVHQAGSTASESGGLAGTPPASLPPPWLTGSRKRLQRAPSEASAHFLSCCSSATQARLGSGFK